ncbi:adenylate/guanylate cyclase domain-containing protein [Nocardioides sp.]|uniref:adenylate/guanylate cyclase domain-containing protein n=1 Tax=Nocardioides sp. TaxID=35761 RepID=UPI002BD52A7E|nr:adenylate/guanylate cyclase domain-containing protein [Nocardioides sp.]HSX66599.1 adenylate/guanylate cyclase domain-containing protein [Nocardioides sp.]
MQRPGLAFDDPDVEREFVDADNRAAVPRVRLCALLALALSVPFVALDLTTLHGERPLVVLLLVLSTCCLATVLPAMTWWPAAHRHVQLAAAGAVTAYSWCASVGAAVTGAAPDYAAFTAVLMLLGAVGVARVRFRTALLTAVLTVPLALGVMLLSYEVPGYQLAFEVMCFAAFALLNLAVALFLEQSKRRMFLVNRALAAERQRSEELLHNVLPAEIVSRLHHTPAPIADSYEQATVLFADIVGFTPLSSSLPAAEVVRLLDRLFSRFDDLCAFWGMEKIKTIGDAYMAVAGVPTHSRDHAARAAGLALDMQREAALLTSSWPGGLALRIGISSGPVVAGVIGHRKFAFDLWGDTVNTASRLEAHGVPGQIHVDEAAHRLLAHGHVFSGPHRTELKGKGVQNTYFLLAPAQSDHPGAIPRLASTPSHPTSERRRTAPCPEPADCPP